MTSRRDRLLNEGMRLFGEQGYAATSVAQIEEAAGLSPGSGSLYKHFRSKRELLEVGLDRVLESRDAQTAAAKEPADPEQRLRVVARAGLARMEQDRDLSRLLFRGLDSFPELLARFGEEEIKQAQQRTAAMLSELAGDSASGTDWGAVAAVVQGAVANYWFMRDLFGAHPTGVSERRYVAAVASMALALVQANADESSS